MSCILGVDGKLRGDRPGVPEEFEGHRFAAGFEAKQKLNIGIMRAFVRLRLLLSSNAELAQRLDEFEKRYDEQFQVVFQAIRELMTPPPVEPRGDIGFRLDEPKG
jgi:hypothetical protein